MSNPLFNQFGLESKAGLEIEKVFIARIVNFKELKLADKSARIEQWIIASKTGSPGNGTVRVRAYDNKRYEMCIKHYPEQFNRGMAREKEFEIDRETFEMFKAIAPIGFIKTLYEFKVPNSKLVWEFDVYHDRHDKPIDWCKIDLEVPDMSVATPEFPIQVADVIDRRDKQLPADQEQFIYDLFQNKFNIYNEVNILPIDARGT